MGRERRGCANEPSHVSERFDVSGRRTAETSVTENGYDSYIMWRKRRTGKIMRLTLHGDA